MFQTIAIALLLLSASLLAQTPGSTPAPESNLAPLFTHLWRVTTAAPQANPTSMYVFLPSGTLLETSCVETYRIATWKVGAKHSASIEVTEDGRLAFTATLSVVTAKTLHLRQTMALGNHEDRDLTLTAIDQEFVCPDMPR